VAILRKQVESRRAYMQRRKTVVVGMILALGLAGALTVLLVGCSNVSPTLTPPPMAHPSVAPSPISDAQNVVQAAAEAADSPASCYSHLTGAEGLADAATSRSKNHFFATSTAA